MRHDLTHRAAAAVMYTLWLGCTPASLRAEPASEQGGPWRLQHDLSVQALHGRERLAGWLGDANPHRSTVELRWNLRWTCEAGACEGVRVVLKPRAWLMDESKPPAWPSQRPDALPEAYVLAAVGAVELGAGKRLMGWGPSMLYSPTNRLFPDNGATTPRKEISGKPMFFAGMTLPAQGRATALLADPALEPLPGLRRSGPFGLVRAEWAALGEHAGTLGLVAGGGGAFQPHAGAYGQVGLDDAWTLSAEFAASRGYARANGDPVPALAQNRGRWRRDATLGLRYGAASGADVGLELIHNGYALSPQELADPTLAAARSAGSLPWRNRPLHPLAQRRYVLLQTTWPKLFGDRRFGFTARVLRGLREASTDAFGELAYSPGDAATVYLGASRSRASPSLGASRPFARSAYLALEIHL